MLCIIFSDTAPLCTSLPQTVTMSARPGRKRAPKRPYTPTPSQGRPTVEGNARALDAMNDKIDRLTDLVLGRLPAADNAPGHSSQLVPAPSGSTPPPSQSQRVTAGPGSQENPPPIIQSQGTMEGQVTQALSPPPNHPQGNMAGPVSQILTIPSTQQDNLTSPNPQTLPPPPSQLGNMVNPVSQILPLPSAQHGISTSPNPQTLPPPSSQLGNMAGPVSQLDMASPILVASPTQQVTDQPAHSNIPIERVLDNSEGNLMCMRPVGVEDHLESGIIDKIVEGKEFIHFKPFKKKLVRRH